ncbi:hypothetical protein LCGC14_0831670 [marine sediment metagenome]|uniref:Uncharacterized protein n=1 Tax=marine sediment metagenome TaxID=412755 RepID=A0A0F9SMW0_9ZZZZ
MSEYVCGRCGTLVVYFDSARGCPVCKNLDEEQMAEVGGINLIYDRWPCWGTAND